MIRGNEFLEQGSVTPEQLASAELDAFVMNQGLAEMAGLFGAEELSENRHDRLHVLQDVARNHWDFRKGAERQVVNWNQELLDIPDSEQWHVIFGAADKLGLVQNTKPQNKNPDALVILGGANKAPLDRLRYGLEVVDSFGYVTYLGSSRPVSDAERTEAAGYALDARTEFDLGCGAIETLLGGKVIEEVKTERDGDVWLTRVYQFERDGVAKHAFVLSTPQTIGAHRATTYDNYRFFAGRAGLTENPDQSIVAVTTGFYSRGQHLPAVQELTAQYGTKVETIGHSAEYSGVVRKPAQLLQETKAAIDAAVRLEVLLTS
jgi:hypothetical protein